MMQTKVMTMPIKPQHRTTLGMLIAPTIMEYISNAMGIESILSTNTLNTYSEKDSLLSTYISDIEMSDIKYNYSFNDKENSHLIMKIIQKMVDNDIIQSSNEEVMRCECGKVDILSSAVRSFSDGKLYKKKDDGNYYCAECGKMCKVYHEEVLTISINFDNEHSKIKIVPVFLKKELDQLKKDLNNSKILISKVRNTGYIVEKSGKLFNIDIDFMWMNYSNLIEADKKILIASNHQLLKMLIMNYINSLYTEQDLIFVAHPYIKYVDYEGVNNIYNRVDDKYFKKLLLLYQLNWNMKTCNCSESIIKYLCNISNTRRLNLYSSIIDQSKDYQLSHKSVEDDVFLYKMITNSINMQKNIPYSKKYVKSR